MYIRLRLLIVLNFLLLIISGRSLIAQRDELNSEGENYLADIQSFYERILKSDSTNYDALTNLGVIFQSTEGGGDLKKSLSYFEKAVKLHPKKSRTYHNLGILYSLMNQLDNAVINLNKAAQLDTTSPNSIRQLGIIYLQNDMFSNAIEAFSRALNRDKFDVESRLGKSLAFWSLEEYDSVLAEINEMQSLGLRFNRMELLLADVYFKKNDYDKAMKYAKLDKSENSSQAEGHYLLGVLYKMKDEKDKAEFEFEEAFTIASQNLNSSLTFSINLFFESNIKKQLE